MGAPLLPAHRTLFNATEPVDDVEHAVLPSVVGAVLDEVVGPDMVRVLRPQPQARAVAQPEPALLGLLPRDLNLTVLQVWEGWIRSSGGGVSLLTAWAAGETTRQG